MTLLPSAPTLEDILTDHLELATELRELAEGLDPTSAATLTAAAAALEGLCAGTRNRERIISALRDTLSQRPAPGCARNGEAPPPGH